MNKNLRKILDWIELPFAILFVIVMSEMKKVNARKFYERNPNHWRKNSVPFKIVKWFLG